MQRWPDGGMPSVRAAVGRRARAARAAARAAHDRRAGRARLHFLHVGKTGGTAVKAAFGDDDVVTPTHRLVLHGHEVTLADVPDGERVVVVVRDPVSRFVSAFNSRLRRGRPRYDAPWSPGEAAAFAAFPTADALARALGDPSRRERAVEAMHAVRHVRDPLTRWLGQPGDLDHARIALAGWLDDLPEVVAELTWLLGAGPVELPSDPVAAHRTPPGLDTVLSEDGEANVRRWYAGDYAVIEALRRAALLR